MFCVPQEDCLEIKRKILKISKRMKKENGLTFEDFKSIALDKGVSYLKFEKKSNGIRIYIRKKPIIRKLKYLVKDNELLDVDKIAKIARLQEGVYYQQNEIEDAKKRVVSWLIERGFLGVNIKVNKEVLPSSGLSLRWEVSYKSILSLGHTNIDAEDNLLVTELLRVIKKMKGKPYSRINFKLVLDEIITKLKKEGYLKAKIEFKEKNYQNKIDLNLRVLLGNRTQFSFTGNKFISRDTLVTTLKKAISDGSVIMRLNDLREIINKVYINQGIYDSKIKIYKRNGLSLNKEKIETYFISIKEGVKYRLKNLYFKGNIAIDIKTLEELYFKKSSTLSSRGFLDEKYLTRFTSVLKSFYLKRGFIFIDISSPRIFKNDKDKTAEVTYVIKERQQSIIEKIELVGVDDNFRLKILNSMKNKVGLSLNVIELENDLVRVLDALRASGFFYARILNLNDSNVVSYESNYTKSTIRLELETGKKVILENFIISGNKVTKNIVIEREVLLKKGDLITPESLKYIRDKINGLGLFGKVQVLPVVVNKLSKEPFNKTNLIIQVQEKKFGRGEIAPGYRTDIGAKISFTISKANLLGLNDSGTVRFQLNRRFSLTQFDERRASEQNQKIEGIGTLNYTFPYLLNTADFSGNFSIQRRRFFSFDADILRISPQLTKQVTKSFGLSLKYQYEKIRQFDATEAKDRATFEIGGLTPGITLDLRDSPVSPRSGAYFGISFEFANPSFGSQNDDDLEINFSKIISRNRFYIPIGSKSFVLALSAAAGLQENYADDENGVNSDGSKRTRGYIPSIKVFRLDGFDIVRGFADNEINRLNDGEDIITKRVQGKAYFANFKIEPRYYIDDTFVIGPFFDAGRIFISNFKPLDLRTSGGLTLKFLTPVGTLDFDYGVKLKRERFSGGRRETFGRFNLSIGYF